MNWWLYVTLIILAIICTEYWHGQEPKKWFEWKQRQLYIVDLMQKKEEAGWSDDSIYQYGKYLSDSLCVKDPIDCPYCILKKKINSYGK